MGKLKGIEFLKHNAIEEKACDLKRPFAFISYAHDEEDTPIVINVFQRLYDRGYNLWIDAANIPKNENSWKDAAQEALMNEEKTCKLALFFRSEESLIRKPILDELEMIKILKHIDRIITIDIWHEDGMTAKKYGQQLISRLKKKELKIYKEICEYVDPDNSAYRGQDVNHNLEVLVNELAKELERDGVMAIRRGGGENPPPVQPETYHTVTFYSQDSLVGSQTVKKGEKAVSPEKVKREGFHFKGWSAAAEGSRMWDFHHDTVSEDMALHACWEKEIPPVPGPEVAGEGYTYTIFGKPYSAGKREQGKLMYDVFAALTDRHPDKAEALTKCTCVARAENVTSPDTADAYPSYFRMCERFTVRGQDYYVGVSYSFDTKLGQIKKMLSICGEKADAFILLNEDEAGGPQQGDSVTDDTPDGTPHTGGEVAPPSNPDSVLPGEGYIYTIFGSQYSAGKREQGKLMFDVFAALTDRHPDKADALTKLTCVARAENVSNAGSADANPTYFKMCRKFTVGDRDYCVGTAYGFKAKLAQIKGMLKICGEKDDTFILISQSGSAESEGGLDGPVPVVDVGNGFEYELWGIVHRAGTLADMMHNSFDALAERYPHKAEDMADDEGLTAVARKNDVDQKKLPSTKLNYFQQKREHKAGGKEYYVSNRYNRDGGIEQIRKMFIICEGNSGSFKVVKMPEKKTKQTSGSGKEGIGTLI